MKTLRPSKVVLQDRAYHFHRHFGAISTFADSYLVETGVFPDQNADLRPTECTGYTVAEMGAAEDKQRYSPDYNFMKTLEVMNEPPNSEGADLRTAAKIPCTFGLLPQPLEPDSVKHGSQAWAANQSNWPLSLDAEALKNKKVNYLPITNGLQDFFDSIRTALVVGQPENRIVGVGTQWSPDFEGITNILPDNPQNLYWGHAYAIVGWKTIAGQPYLVAKTWQGTNYGDGGYCYLSRTLTNKLLKAWGAYAFTLQDTGRDILHQEFNLLEVIIALIKNGIISMKK